MVVAEEMGLVGVAAETGWVGEEMGLVGEEMGLVGEEMGLVGVAANRREVDWAAVDEEADSEGEEETGWAAEEAADSAVEEPPPSGRCFWIPLCS